MSAGYFPKREKIGLEDLFRGLVTASHILHHHGVLDAYGHISVRSPDNPATFWMPCDMSPALVSRPEDLVEYKVEDASEVEKDAKEGFVERYVHSEMYKKFPGVNAVVHSHCPDVLPYCISDVPLKATTHMSGFLGPSVPLWDITPHYASSSPHDNLIRTSPLGASLASTLKPSTSATFLYTKVRSALPAQIGGSTAPPDTEPNHAVVLMQNHGFTTVAHGIEEVVFQAIYTREAARVQTEGAMLAGACAEMRVEGRVDVEGGGKIKAGRVRGEGVRALGGREAGEAWEAVRKTVGRPWVGWVREVEVQALYVNECPRGED